MVLTKSSMIDLGSTLPDFSLVNTVNGEMFRIGDTFHAKGVLIMFICNHCPYVKHINNKLVEITNEYLNKEIAIVGINSNNVEKYEEDSPANMKLVAEEQGYKFPYLFDEKQSVAKKFNAVCTPEFYLYNAERKLVYRGRFDSSRPGADSLVTGQDLKNALESLVTNKPISEEQYPSMGCNIKWK
ncbi:MAG: thioredoxin family protein [Bacteriovoracaceae bacterium]